MAGLVEESIVDGPGIRYVVFTQGCHHQCLGCHNPETHSLEDGYWLEIEYILGCLDKNPLLSGITLSGGDPFVQVGPSKLLCEKVRERGLTTMVYTGYTWEQVLNQAKLDQDYMDFLEVTDILVDGPYIEAEKDLLLRFRGSRNQRIIDVPSSLREGKIVEIDL